MFSTYVHYFGWRTKNGNPLFPPSLPAFEAIAFQFRAAEANNFGPEMQA